MLLEPKAIQDVQRQFNIGAPSAGDATNTPSQPDAADQPSQLDSARWPLGPAGARSDRPTAPSAASDWVTPLPFNQSALPAQDAPGGIPGLLMQVDAFDPSHPDDPPAGGLLRLIQDYMRNNPDRDTTR